MEGDRAGHIVGAVPIGKVIGGYSRSTVLRWHGDDLLAPWVFKGPYRNSELRLKRDDIPALRKHLRGLGIEVTDSTEEPV